MALCDVTKGIPPQLDTILCQVTGQFLELCVAVKDVKVDMV